MEYPKINTLFKRDEKNVIIPTEFSEPEFEYLKDLKWEATEKVDGTNTRVILNPPTESSGPTLEFRGRTDNADMPKHLVKKLSELFELDKLLSIFSSEDKPLDNQVILYGEGYGMKIQKGGNYIPDDVNFRLFDIKIGNWWLKRDACEEIATKLGIDIVPLISYMTIDEAIEFVKKGFKSTIAYNKDYDAEGLVLKTPVGLLSRSGKRLITKIKTKDFNQYKKVHG